MRNPCLQMLVNHPLPSSLSILVQYPKPFPPFQSHLQIPIPPISQHPKHLFRAANPHFAYIPPLPCKWHQRNPSNHTSSSTQLPRPSIHKLPRYYIIAVSWMQHTTFFSREIGSWKFWFGMERWVRWWRELERNWESLAGSFVTQSHPHPQEFERLVQSRPWRS